MKFIVANDNGNSEQKYLLMENIFINQMSMTCIIMNH